MAISTYIVDIFVRKNFPCVYFCNLCDLLYTCWANHLPFKLDLITDFTCSSLCFHCLYFKHLMPFDCKEEKLVMFLDFFLSNCFYWYLLVSCLVVSSINYSKSLIQISYAPRTMGSLFFLLVASSCIRNLLGFSSSQL